MVAGTPLLVRADQGFDFDFQHPRIVGRIFMRRIAVILASGRIKPMQFAALDPPLAEQVFCCSDAPGLDRPEDRDLLEPVAATASASVQSIRHPSLLERCR